MTTVLVLAVCLPAGVAADLYRLAPVTIYEPIEEKS